MKQLLVDYPEDLPEAIQLTPVETAAQIRLMAALKMFELGELSSGKAAELAGLSRVEFLEACGRYRVSPFNYPAEELEDELRSDLEAIQVPPNVEEIARRSTARDSPGL
jgi:predicted HTH domain antitoxin